MLNQVSKSGISILPHLRRDYAFYTLTVARRIKEISAGNPASTTMRLLRVVQEAKPPLRDHFILEAIQDNSLDVVASAALLGHLMKTPKRAFGVLNYLLAHSNTYIAAMAADSGCKIREPKYRDIIIEKAAQHPDFKVRLVAATNLWRMEDGNKALALFKDLENDPVDAVRRDTIKFLNG